MTASKCINVQVQWSLRAVSADHGIGTIDGNVPANFAGQKTLFRWFAWWQGTLRLVVPSRVGKQSSRSLQPSPTKQSTAVAADK